MFDALLAAATLLHPQEPGWPSVWRPRVGLAFYAGCLNLHAHQEELGVPVCFPTARQPGGSALRFSHLVDPT